MRIPCRSSHAGQRLAGWLAAIGLGAALPTTRVAADSYLVYVGTFASPTSQGIYSFQFDTATGQPAAAAASLVVQAASPSTLALHPNGQCLYAANEIDSYGGQSSGSVSAYAIHAGGALTLLNVQASGGPGPCFISLDSTGQCALVAHYNGGCVSTLPIGADGRLGAVATLIQHTGSSVDPVRQTHAYAHWIAPDPTGHHALVCDLGLDRVFTYRFDASHAALAAGDPPFAGVKPGFGPRHLAFHPDGRWVYVITEMGNAMVVFSYDSTQGALREIQSVSTLPADFTGQSSGAEVAVHPNGRFVYGSNRGHDSIVVYAVDQASGRLALVQHQSTLGRTPRTFALDPSGRWLLAANQDSNSVAVFGVDPGTGRLTPTPSKIDVGMPTCLVFLPAR
jgi:6-phosphogluconolactonase